MQETPNIPEKFLKPYDSSENEQAIYDLWERSGYFNPDACIKDGICSEDAEHFSIVLPPPNVTGELHLGHAFEDSTQDAMIRFNRMRGRKTLWVPGTDHAAIATQSKFEKELYKKEKKSRHDFPREDFFDLVQEFALANQSTILSQLKRMGTSLDWSRLRFTLDDERQQAVVEAFKRMYDAGLIYQAGRIVNWDPKGQTTISDDEIIYKEETTKFYYFKYGPFTIGTARPETKFADKYIIVNPHDKRYAEYEHMQQFEIEWINGPITATLIKDDAADPELGTGAMTITPWHSQVDFELAQKYDLPIEQIIDQYGKLLPIAGEFAGMKITEAREKIVEKLASKGLVEKIDDAYVHSLATAERTGATVEPQVMEQWWINVSKKFPYPHDTLPGIQKGQEVSLKDLMLHVVESEQVSIMPERFDKIYRHWIENLRDWNISRQIIYGHRIPVWYKDDELQVSFDSPGEGWVQDTDTLDTWFSSGLWSFSTLGWPSATKDFETYHPTSVLNPGYEILPLWVSRMILMSTFLTGQIPFKTAYIHGMLRDKNGQKFSKSLNNGINPLEVIDEFGTDALRMALTVGVAPGQDMNFDLQKVRAYKKFANKLWNMTRFILENIQGSEYDPAFTAYSPTDQELLECEQSLLREITKEMEEYKFYIVAEKLYHYAWHEIADNVLEESKAIFADGSTAEIDSRKQFLIQTLRNLLITLHPFMPYITETIWQELPAEVRQSERPLMVAKWPTVQEN